MAHSKRMFLALAASLALSTSAMSMDMIGKCELSGTRGSIPILSPAKAGQLTVQVSLPAPIWWNGDTPEAIQARLDAQASGVRTLFTDHPEAGVAWIDARNPGRVYFRARG